MVISINRSGGVMDVGCFCEWGDEFVARYAVSKRCRKVMRILAVKRSKGSRHSPRRVEKYKVFESYMINILLAHG